MRRTKEEAARTRQAIVGAALACFDRYGIARSTLERIAACAGVSKGAIYHHFAGKREILREIREQVSLPFLDEADTTLLRRGEPGALDRVERFLLGILATLERDARKRLALTVMQLRCEYVGDMAGELRAIVRNVERLTQALEGAYRQARAAGELARGLSPPIAALETIMFMNGLLRLWIVHARASPVRRNARAAIRAHVRLHRRSPSARG
jgi:TetR/AcrR family transcriptional regulator, acrAB operon repressor